MALNWKQISALLKRSESLLVGSTVQKIAQVKDLVGGDSIYLQGFGGGGSWKVWTCLHQDMSCWVLAPDDWDLPSQSEPSTFIMVLRKHLLGKKIVGYEQLAHERIFLLHFETKQSLLFEILPKRSNVLLVDDWSAEKRQARFITSFRQVSLETGGIYSLPPPPPASVTELVDLSAEEIQNIHETVGEEYFTKVNQTDFRGLQRLFRQQWKSHSKKVKAALETAQKALEESREAENYHRFGMILVAHLYELGPRAYPKMKTIELDGVEIPLDKGKSYSDNSDALFKKSKKYTRASSEMEPRVQELSQRILHLEKVSEKIEKVSSEEELEKLSKEFEKEGLKVPSQEKAAAKVAVTAKPYLEVESSEGFLILCGRNQEENRRVTFHEAKGNDLWLHVKGIPGAHVVVKSQRNKTVPLNTILEAAQICLYHSKIRKGKRAEVDYTQRKHVRAIKGTLAEVTYTGNKSVYVEADPEKIKTLMRNS